MTEAFPGMTVTWSERVLVIRFDAWDALRYPESLQYQQEIAQLLDRHADCRVVRLDLDGVRLLASDFLGFLLMLCRRGLVVQLQNLDENLRTHLEVTRLDQLLEVCRPNAC